MNILTTQSRIIQLMSVFVTEVKGYTAMTRTDINHAAETVLIPIFREVYGYKNLKNLNSDERENYPGIDLGDEDARVAFQITSSTDSEKVKHTLEQFVKYDLHNKYDRLIIYMLTEKQRSYSGNGFSEIIQGYFQFDKNKDIQDYRDVLALVRGLQIDSATVVKQILEKNFGGQTSVNLREQFLAIQVEQQQLAKEADQARVAQTETLQTIQQETAQQQTKEITDSVSDILHQLLSANGIRQPTVSVEETVFSAKLDLVRDLLQDGKASAAKKALLKLRSEAAYESASLEVKFRIATQLGACAYELGDIDVAITELTNALALRPNDLVALTNAATAAALIGNVDQALQFSIRARQLEKESSEATSIYIGVLHHQNRFDEIKQLIVDEPWIITDAMCLTTLGDLKFRDGEYENAVHYLRHAISIDDKHPLPFLLLAQAILVPLQKLLHEDPLLPDKQDNPTTEKRTEALQALTVVITLTEDYDNPEMRHLALANRAGVLAALGQMNEAEQDCDKVLADDKNHETALRNKGQILMRNGDKERAIQYFERITSETERKGVALPLATLYGSLGRVASVIELLTPLWETPSREHDKIFIADMLMNAYSKLGRTDQAAQIEADLIRDWPDDPDMLSLMSSRRMAEGNQVEAVALLEQSMAVARGNARNWATFRLAQLYYKLGNFVMAAETYKSFVDIAKDSVELREYVYSLYRTNQSQKALEIARFLRGSGAPIPLVSEIEASILEQLGEWNEAAAILYQLIEVQPQHLPICVRLVRVELQRGDGDAAKAAAQKVPFEAIKDDAELLMRMAYARNRLDMPEVLRFAYQARRLNYDEASMHASYIQLFSELNAADEAVLSIFPTVMDEDCSIRLLRNGQPLAFTLIDEVTTHEAQSEIGLAHPYAAKLRGLRVGDPVILQDDPFHPIGYDVVEIQSKYVFAFQESLKLFETGLFHDPGIFVVNINNPLQTSA